MDKETLIEKYLENSLSAEELAQFQEWMDTDDAFREAFEFQLSLKAAITLEERKGIKQILETTRKRRQQRWVWFSAAASILVALGLFLIFSLSGPSPDKLYLAYYEPHPNVVAPSVRGNNDTTLTAQAYLAYDNSDFTTAAAIFERLYLETGSASEAFYWGISLMESGDQEGALEAFGHIHSTDEFGTYKLWYAALANLKLGNTSESEALLQDFVSYDTPIQNKALKLLEALN